MDSRLFARRLSERGVTSTQFLLVGAFSLVLFLMFANLVVVQYGRAAIRSALDQGVRVGALTGASADCEERVRLVLDQLLAGAMGDDAVTTCRVGGGLVVADGSATFISWTPFTSDFEVRLSAEATVEPYRE